MDEAVITVTGNVNGGLIDVNDMDATTIEVDGDVGESATFRSIQVYSDMANSSRIYVHGSLINDASDYEILVLGDFDATSAICINSDGWNALDDWQSGATVVANESIYYGNSPEYHIWAVTHCAGDMNNDGDFNNFDIDPFVAALLWNDDNENGVPDYIDAFPGLEASVIFHGDVNCDDAFDDFDIDPFTDKILYHLHCCECDGGCGSLLRGGSLQSFGNEVPVGVSHGEALRTGLTSETLLLGLIDHITTRAAIDVENEYWTDVLTGLTDSE